MVELLDITNFLGRFAIWVLIGLCISIYSNSSIRASINVFVFFSGMVTSYYLYSKFVAGFFPWSYALIWVEFTVISPLLAFVCWYAKGKSKLVFGFSAMILAILFNMSFVYGSCYFEMRSILELFVFICGFVVVKCADRLLDEGNHGTTWFVIARKWIIEKDARNRKEPGISFYRTDFAYSVGVIPNFSLNCREKWWTVEYWSWAAISVKLYLFSRIICLLSWSLIRRIYSPGLICRFLWNRAVR